MYKIYSVTGKTYKIDSVASHMYKIYTVAKQITKTTQPVKPRVSLVSHLYPLVGYPFV